MTDSDDSGKFEETARLKRQGHSNQEIADRLGISRSSVRYRLEKAGISTGPGRTPDTEILADIADAADEVEGRLSEAEYRELGGFHKNTVYARFDTWQDALDAAEDGPSGYAVVERTGDGREVVAEAQTLDELEERIAGVRR